MTGEPDDDLDPPDHCCTCDSDAIGWPEAMARIVIALVVGAVLVTAVLANHGALPW